MPRKCQIFLLLAIVPFRVLFAIITHTYCAIIYAVSEAAAMATAGPSSGGKGLKANVNGAAYDLPWYNAPP